MPGPIDFNAKTTAANLNRGGIKNDTNPQNSKEKIGSIFNGIRSLQATVSGSYEGTVSHTEVGKNPEKHDYGVQTKDDVVERFKQLDKDGDLKVSADEYINDFIDDCRSNGYGAKPGQNFADIIAEKYEEFKKFAGEDVSMNIDEFRNMVEERLNQTNTMVDNTPEKAHKKNNVDSNVDTAIQKQGEEPSCPEQSPPEQDVS